MQGYWLLKTEPDDYSWSDLVQEGETVWDGVKAGMALKKMAEMKQGDLAFIYHTGKERTIVGIAEVTSNPYPDPNSDNERHLVIRVKALEKLQRPVTLKEIKASNLFPDWELVRYSRLSIVPVQANQWQKILAWEGA